MILPVRQIHLHLAEDGVFFVGPLDKPVVFPVACMYCGIIAEEALSMLFFKHRLPPV